MTGATTVRERREAVVRAHMESEDRPEFEVTMRTLRQLGFLPELPPAA